MNEFLYKRKRKIVGEWKITAFLKRIPLLIQEGFYAKKSGAEKYRGKRVKYDCHNNYSHSSSRAGWERESGMKTFAIRTSMRQKEKFTHVSYAKKMAVGQLQIRVRITQERGLVPREHSDWVYFANRWISREVLFQLRLMSSELVASVSLDYWLWD